MRSVNYRLNRDNQLANSNEKTVSDLSQQVAVTETRVGELITKETELQRRQVWYYCLLASLIVINA